MYLAFGHDYVLSLQHLGANAEQDCMSAQGFKDAATEEPLSEVPCQTYNKFSSAITSP